MAQITKPAIREIVEDFAKEIKERRRETAKPSKEVINFRGDKLNGIEREVSVVPIDLLRFRKDNGRIASDVIDYERNFGPLDEKDDHAQSVIREFLEKKDPERTEALNKSIAHGGQNEASIITCDGFLINGNRRKMVMDRLHHENPAGDKYRFMKAVILPGKGDPGGPPTLLEIEQIENRYQLQSDGKSEYYRFDRALSIKRKIDLGFSLEEQLLDDPAHAGSTKPDLLKAIARCQKDYLDPLDRIDHYLEQFNRRGLYRTISKGIADPDGRWQAFIDYSKSYRVFTNPKRRMEIGLEEDEIGDIEEAAFDVIRLRSVPNMPKVHVIMRNLPKYLGTEEGKKAIKKIVDEVDPILPAEESIDSEGKPLSLEVADAKWAARSQESIIHNLRVASQSFETQKERETPIELLREAFKKLSHQNMDLSLINNTDLPTAREIASDIWKRAQELDSDIFNYEKNLKKLAKKGS